MSGQAGGFRIHRVGAHRGDGGAHPESSVPARRGDPNFALRTNVRRPHGRFGASTSRGKCGRRHPKRGNHAGKRPSGKNSLNVLHCGREWVKVGPTLNRTGMAGFLPPRHPRSRIRRGRAFGLGVSGAIRVHAGCEEPAHDPAQVPGRPLRRDCSRQGARPLCVDLAGERLASAHRADPRQPRPARRGRARPAAPDPRGRVRGPARRRPAA